jgi:adenosylhomocysteine nucleosidase|tara:strand:+ start:427 stop:1023 length:597 start_codon:yes stop_codon:yes gene_type:complete
MWTDDDLLRTSDDKIILVSATPLERGGVNWVGNYPIFNVGIGKINSAMNMVDLIHRHQPEVVINFGSCGNLQNHKVGEVMEVGTVYNNVDARPFAEYGCTPESPYCEIKLSDSGIECFTTDQIYDNTRTDYAKKYLEMINKCDIVDMECYSLAYVCKIFNIEFKSFKWVSDDGNVDTWEENAAIGFENFKKVLDNLDI